jgi:hypothetical protein
MFNFSEVLFGTFFAQDTLRNLIVLCLFFFFFEVGGVQNRRYHIICGKKKVACLMG